MSVNFKKKIAIASGFILAFTCSSILAQGQEKYGFGTTANKDEIARYDIDIETDGTGLPTGSGTAVQGAEIFEVQCAICHGDNLQGVREMGAQSMREGRRDIRKLPHTSSLFDFVRRAMPLTDPGTLSNDETYSLVAYLLNEAGILKDKNAAVDAKTLAAIKMPNRNNFIIDPASHFTAEDLKD